MEIITQSQAAKKQYTKVDYLLNKRSDRQNPYSESETASLTERLQGTKNQENSLIGGSI